MSDYSGRDFGRYHVIEHLGQGGMAAVYKAFDTRLERHVALKVIRSVQAEQPGFLLRFEREAKALAQLDHPHIVKVLDYGDQDGIPYLVMVYLPGGTLKQVTGRPLPYREAAALVSPVARALAYAHQMKLIHRDVKPANILLTAGGLPMLSDFGIAKLMEGGESMQLTATGMGIGTPEYMAPEQWVGKVTPQTDIYALGVVFFELVTGRRPYVADTPAAVLLKQTNDALPRPRSFVPELPEVVEQVIFKALAKRSEDRFDEMDKFAQALENLQHDKPMPDLKISYEATQAVGSQTQAALQALLESARGLENTGSPLNALDLYRRALTLCPANSEMETKVRESIVRLESQLPAAATIDQLEPISSPQPQQVKTGAGAGAGALAQAKKKRFPVWLFVVLGAVGVLAVLGVAGVWGVGRLLAKGSPTALPTTAAAAVLPENTALPTATLDSTEPPSTNTPPQPMETATLTLTPEPTATFAPFEAMLVESDYCSDQDIIQKVDSLDRYTVRFTLCKPQNNFLEKLSVRDFGIQSSEVIVENGGAGAMLRHPIGTGPFRFEDWQLDYIQLQRFDDYWGKPADFETLIIRWTDDNGERLSLMAAGEVDYLIDSTGELYEAASQNENYSVKAQDHAHNLFLGILNRNRGLLADPNVRQVLAMGIDRELLVETYLPPGSDVATHVTPCYIQNGCLGADWYGYDPEQARELLTYTGHANGFAIDLYYYDYEQARREGFYKPIAETIQKQLLELGIDVTLKPVSSMGSVLFDPDIDGLYVLGWGADFSHVSGYLQMFTGDLFGDRYDEIAEAERLAVQEIDPVAARELYRQVNELIREQVPMVPIGHRSYLHIYSDAITGISTSPFGLVPLNTLETQQDEIVYLQALEPESLYCNDTYLGGASDVCLQIFETLLTVDETGKLVSRLAESWEMSEDGLQYTFKLREGVKFHNGSPLDANDVVMTFEAMLDVNSLYHTGNGNGFESVQYTFGLMNDDQ